MTIYVLREKTTQPSKFRKDCKRFLIDELLSQGMERWLARDEVEDGINKVLEHWRINAQT
jgi:hypothetical protein